MTQRSNPTGRSISHSPGASSVPRYSINQYIKHAPSVKQFNEWLIDDYQNQLQNKQRLLLEKESLLEVRTKELTEKEVQLQLAKQELGQLKDASIIQFSLGLLSALLSGYGINLVTSSPPLIAGWVMIIAAAIIQIISFVMTYFVKFRK